MYYVDAIFNLAGYGPDTFDSLASSSFGGAMADLLGVKTTDIIITNVQISTEASASKEGVGGSSTRQLADDGVDVSYYVQYADKASAEAGKAEVMSIGTATSGSIGVAAVLLNMKLRVEAGLGKVPDQLTSASVGPVKSSVSALSDGVAVISPPTVRFLDCPASCASGCNVSDPMCTMSEIPLDKSPSNCDFICESQKCPSGCSAKLQVTGQSLTANKICTTLGKGYDAVTFPERTDLCEFDTPSQLPSQAQLQTLSCSMKTIGLKEVDAADAIISCNGSTVKTLKLQVKCTDSSGCNAETSIEDSVLHPSILAFLIAFILMFVTFVALAAVLDARYGKWQQRTVVFHKAGDDASEGSNDDTAVAKCAGGNNALLSLVIGQWVSKHKYLNTLQAWPASTPKLFSRVDRVLALFALVVFAWSLDALFAETDLVKVEATLEGPDHAVAAALAPSHPPYENAVGVGFMLTPLHALLTLLFGSAAISSAMDMSTTTITTTTTTFTATKNGKSDSEGRLAGIARRRIELLFRLYTVKRNGTMDRAEFNSMFIDWAVRPVPSKKRLTAAERRIAMKEEAVEAGQGMVQDEAVGLLSSLVSGCCECCDLGAMKESWDDFRDEISAHNKASKLTQQADDVFLQLSKGKQEILAKNFTVFIMHKRGNAVSSSSLFDSLSEFDAFLAVLLKRHKPPRMRLPPWAVLIGRGLCIVIVAVSLWLISEFGFRCKDEDVSNWISLVVLTTAMDIAAGMVWGFVVAMGILICAKHGATENKGVEGEKSDTSGSNSRSVIHVGSFTEKNRSRMSNNPMFNTAAVASSDNSTTHAAEL
jgi:hypothetical protein